MKTNGRPIWWRKRGSTPHHDPDKPTSGPIASGEAGESSPAGSSGRTLWFGLRTIRHTRVGWLVTIAVPASLVGMLVGGTFFVIWLLHGILLEGLKQLSRDLSETLHLPLR